MDIEKILSSDIINLSALAKQLWPEISAKNAIVKLQNKITGRQRQRITEKDMAGIEAVLTELLK